MFESNNKNIRYTDLYDMIRGKKSNNDKDKVNNKSANMYTNIL